MSTRNTNFVCICINSNLFAVQHVRNFNCQNAYKGLKCIDENISTYGYEDLLFVINNNLKAIYINNPLCHIGLKKNNKFIKDTESALDNLINYSKFTHKYSEKIKIIQIAKTISMFYLDYFIILIFKLLKNSIINNLNSKNPSICLFQFYKLGYFLKKRHSSY